MVSEIKKNGTSQNGHRKRTTLRTISEATGMALTTVSRALKNDPKIAKKTREKIHAAAKELGYRPDRAAQGLRSGRTMTVGLILDQTLAVAEFERRIIAGVSNVIYGETNYNLVVFPQANRGTSMVPVRYLVEDVQVEGLIFAHTTPQDERAMWLLEQNVPFVTHGRTDLGTQHAYCDFDNSAFARMAVENLIAKGRKKIAIIAATPGLTTSPQMEKGFWDAINVGKVDGFLMPDLYLNDDPKHFRETARRLVESGSDVDGIICGMETAAIALMAGLEDRGKIVGKDIDIIARSTSDILDYVTPNIDSLHEDLTKAGETLARFLIQKIQGVSASDLQQLDLPYLCKRT